MNRVGGLTLRAGGKRLRPAFVSLAAAATGLPYDPSRARKLGAGLEMIHMATLIHDDVIDHAAMRRGKPTAAAEVGNTASILSGDVLLARAMSLLAEDGDLDLIRTVSAAVVDMAEGEVREVEVRGDFDLRSEDHFDILQRKTAALVEACCEGGAIIAGAPKPVTEALKAYGHHVGLAFQIADDLLDYRGDPAKTGQTPRGRLPRRPGDPPPHPSSRAAERGRGAERPDEVRRRRHRRRAADVRRLDGVARRVRGGRADREGARRRGPEGARRPAGHAPSANS